METTNQQLILDLTQMKTDYVCSEKKWSGKKWYIFHYLHKECRLIINDTLFYRISFSNGQSVEDATDIDSPLTQEFELNRDRSDKLIVFFEDNLYRKWNDEIHEKLKELTPFIDNEDKFYQLQNFLYRILRENKPEFEDENIPQLWENIQNSN